MPPRKWSEAQRVEALELASSVGFAEAGRQLGMSRRTIESWARRAQGAVEAAVPAATLAPTSLPWAERRAALVPKLGTLVVDTADKIAEAVAEGRLRDARDGAVALGVLIDKAQLLAGGATSRSESRAAVVHLRRESDSTTIEEIQRRRRELGMPVLEVVSGDE